MKWKDIREVVSVHSSVRTQMSVRSDIGALNVFVPSDPVKQTIHMKIKSKFIDIPKNCSPC